MAQLPSVLFVCLGNICRSPAAEGLYRDLASAAGLGFHADSAGTGNWHIGKPPDRRMIKAAAGRGIDLAGLRARQVDVGDFYVFDHILAMDSSNYADLRDIEPADGTAQLSTMLSYGQGGDVPDPYFGGADGFEHVLDLLGESCAGFISTHR